MISLNFDGDSSLTELSSDLDDEVESLSSFQPGVASTSQFIVQSKPRQEPRYQHINSHTAVEVVIPKKSPEWKKAWLDGENLDTPPILATMSDAAKLARNSTAKRSVVSEADEGTHVSASLVALAPAKRAKTTTLRRSKTDRTSSEFLLTDPKSPICFTDITKLVSPTTWNALSEERRKMLVTLMPPTSFSDFDERLYPYHPSILFGATLKTSEGLCEQLDSRQGDLDAFNTSSLTCGFLISAAKTYQDHIYSGYFKPKHTDIVQAFEMSVKKGTIHAPWKDEEWNETHPTIEDEKTIGKGRGKVKAKRKLKAPDIRALAAAGHIRIGDVVAYSRNFPSLDLDVKKDLLVQTIDSRTGAVTFILSPGSVTKLDENILIYPAEALSDVHAVDLTPAFEAQGSSRRNKLTSDIEVTESGREPSGCLSITISTSAAALESHILPLFEYIEPTQRSQEEINSWKCFTVWRWRSASHGRFDRGGRELVGSLHYLRQESMG